MEHASSVCRDTAFCWKNAAQRDGYLLYRICSPDEPRRDIRHVPTEEIINVLCVVLCDQIGLSETDLMRETARKLGYPRLGGAVSTAISDAVLRASEQKLISAASDSSFSLSDEGLRRAQAICHALSSAQ